MNRSMKKNLFFGLMALVGLFTSCSRDDAYTSPTEESNQVSMSIEMPADFVKTRAAVPTFPPNHTLRCILEVWTQDGSTRKVRKEQLVTAGATNFTFNFELADQGDYKAVLWADYIDSGASATNGRYPDKYYKTSDPNGLKAVSISTTEYTYTDRVREAFTAVKTFTKGATAKNDLTATLVRPLTKVTIAEKNAEMFAKCTSIKATYSVPLWFNAFSEEVPATDTYEPTYNAAPVGDVISINGADCKILFSDYVFTAADGTMGGIELTFTGSATLNNRSIPANIPLKRNNWVRAAGNLITAAAGGYDPAVALSVDMTTQWVEHNATDIPDAVTAAKVGDYYYADGTWSTALDATKTCIGIVFQTAPARIGSKEKEVLAAKGITESHGLVMAVKNAATGVTWNRESHEFSELTKCVTKEQCDGDISGLLNYTTVIDYTTANNNLTTYPAFEAVKNYSVMAPATSTGWYLPSVGQLYDIFANLGNLPGWDSATTNDSGYTWSGQTQLVNRINACLSPLGTGNYDAFVPSGSYQAFWSSSVYSKGNVRNWQVHSDGSVQCFASSTAYEYAVRPVLAF